LRKLQNKCFQIYVTLTFSIPLDFPKKQLKLVFGVYDYRGEKDQILAVAKNLHSMNLISEDDIMLFTATSRKALKHSSNLIKINEIKDLINFKNS